MISKKLVMATGLVVVCMLAVDSAGAESPVQPSWHCQAAGQTVISNTPCVQGAQPVRMGATVIHRCEQNGVVSFQQSACKESDAAVHLHHDTRTKKAIASAEKVRKSTVSRAEKARQAQMSRERGDSKVTVIGTQKGTGYGGDGKADGYRKPGRDTASHSGY